MSRIKKTISQSNESPQTADQPLWQPIATRLQSKLEPGLYITATPIGNLRDVTLRVLDALSLCDAIYCEDTRVTKKLLAAYGIRKTLHAYYDHNAARIRPRILKRLQAGEAICLVSDAGTPLISDPGYKLVSQALDQGCMVTSLPGACGPIVALTVSGLPSDCFCFAGFLPGKSAARKRHAERFADFAGTVIWFESPRRLARALADLYAVLGPRQAVIARELTKRFEEVRRGTLEDLAREFDQSDAPKGEVVVLIGPAEGGGAEEDKREEQARAALVKALGTLSTKDAVAEVTVRTGLPRKRVYDLALALKGQPAK